jgi:chemotaxis protein methyltransferase CheR
MVWQLSLAARYSRLALHVLATDIDETLLERAQAACYGASELKELPDAWRTAAFEMRDAQYCLRKPFRASVAFAHQDLCAVMPNRRSPSRSFLIPRRSPRWNRTIADN